MRSPTRSLDYPSTAQSCGHEYCWHGHRPHVRWWNSVGRPYHTDCNGQSIHKVGVTRYGIKLLSCVFQCSLKGPQSYNMYKNPPLGFLMLFCHVFIDAPEKLPKFGAFSTLGTALDSMVIFFDGFPYQKGTWTCTCTKKTEHVLVLNIWQCTLHVPEPIPCTLIAQACACREARLA